METKGRIRIPGASSSVNSNGPEQTERESERDLRQEGGLSQDKGDATLSDGQWLVCVVCVQRSERTGRQQCRDLVSCTRLVSEESCCFGQTTLTTMMMSMEL